MVFDLVENSNTFYWVGLQGLAVDLFLYAFVGLFFWVVVVDWGMVLSY
jgi:hypothetical protein